MPEPTLKDIKKKIKKEEIPSYSLPDIGNKIDYEAFWNTKDFKKSLKNLTDTLGTIERLAIKKNFDPELNKTLALIPFFKKAIREERLKFHAEIPGVNSDRTYFGFEYKF